MAEHNFAPEAPPANYKTVELAELERALLAKRLRRTWPEPKRIKVKLPWGPSRYVWARKQKHPTIRRAEQRCSAQVLTDLRNSILIAYAYQSSTGIFHRIPPSFWLEKVREWPIAFEECPTFVFDRCAHSWLIRHEISETNPAFPAVLRSRPIVQPARPPSDDMILSELTKLRESGMPRDQCVKHIRQIQGFEGVGNELARRVIRKVFKPGPRPRKRV